MKTQDIIAYIFLFLLIVALSMATISVVFHKQEPIQINITGAEDVQLNSTSLAYLQVECIKICNQRFSDYSPLKLCYEQCQKVGVTECNNICDRDFKNLEHILPICYKTCEKMTNDSD